MAVVNKFNVNKQEVRLDADIIENMSANDVSYNTSTQYNENTVGNKLLKLESQAIYDVTANNDGATFASLSALLSSENLSNLIPVAVRCGSMSIRFIQSSDNKYAQYRLMSDTFNITEANWQGVDEEPTAGSDNLVKSRGVYNLINPVIGISINMTKSFESIGLKEYINIDLNSGDVFTFKVTSSNATWQRLALYCNSWSASNILKDNIENWTEYSVTVLHNITVLGLRLIEVTNFGDITLNFSIKGKLEELEEKINEPIVVDVYQFNDNVLMESTVIQDLNIKLKGGQTYILYSQSNGEVASSYGWYDMTRSTLIRYTSSSIAEGDIFEYTPEEDVEIGYRTGVINAIVSIKIYQKGLLTEVINENITKDNEQDVRLSVLENTVYLEDKVIYDNTVLIEIKTVKYIKTLKKGVKYILYSQSNGAIEASSCGWYVLGARIRNTSASIAEGDTFEYTPEEDVEIGYRTGVSGSSVIIKISVKGLNSRFIYNEDLINTNKESIDTLFLMSNLKNYWKDCVVACYGDSITAHAGGDFYQPWDNFPTTSTKQYSWAYYVAREFDFAAYKGRGVGAQGYSWNTISGLAGGSVVFYNSANGETNSRNDSYDLDTYEGNVPVPSECVAGRGSFCSWDRITKSFPVAIKDAIDIVLIMGGTNDPDGIMNYNGLRMM